MKHIYEKGLLPVLKNIVNDLKPIENQCGWSYISNVLTYILEAGEEIDMKDFVDTVKTDLSTITEDIIMTLALKSVAMDLFDYGMTIVQVAKLTGLSVYDVEQLKAKSTN